MPLINLEKVHKYYITDIREEFNIHEKIELARLLLNAIECEHNEAMNTNRMKL